MAKAKERVVKITENVRRAYQLFLSYYPSVYNVSYKVPAIDLEINPEKLSRISKGIAETIRKNELDLLLEKLYEKKKEELQGKIEKNERIPINLVTKEIINKFTEEKGSCKKAALALGCNFHNYEKYNYNHTKTIPRKIFDKIALYIMNKHPLEYSSEKLRKAYPEKLFNPLPWKEDKLKEKFLKKIEKAKTEEKKKKIIENFAWKFLFRELKINKKSELYLYKNKKEGYKYVPINENIRKAFNLASKAMEKEKLLKRLNINQKKLCYWFNKYNRVIPEPIVREIINIINENFGINEIHKALGFSNLEKLLEEAQNKNKVPYCIKYPKEKVENLIIKYVEEAKKRGMNFIKVLERAREKISKSSFYDYIELKKSEVPKSLVDAIYEQIKEWGCAVENENLEPSSERTFISNELKMKLGEISKMEKTKEIAKILGTSTTLIYAMKKGIIKTIPLDKLRKIEDYYNSLNKNIYKDESQVIDIK
ncbi:MAG: hypothetical protein QXK80_02010 [Candidatus Pacearchaeota archaeon]